MSSKLESFLAAYFNQDWPDEYASADEAVADFLSEGRSDEELRAIQSEIDELLARNQSSAELERELLSRFQCYYSPRADGISANDWLCGLSAKFDEALLAN